MCCTVLRDNEQLETWLREGAKDGWPEMLKIVQLINRLLVRQPIPSDPNAHLPTPTAAAWTTIQAIAQQIADITAFVDSRDESNGLAVAMVKACTVPPADARHVQYEYMKLRHELAMLPCNLLAGHMPNLDLDVGGLMRWAFGNGHKIVCCLLSA